MEKEDKGVTFIELLLVVSILLLLVGAMTGAINPMALVNKGKDARRKKDIARIKIAMEGYMADKGCFPTGDLLLNLNNKSYCKSNVFSPWLSIWPCDPTGSPYVIVVEEGASCPDWFKVFVLLENSKDRDILEWWYDYESGVYVLSGGYSNATVNHGVSSTNVLWYERTFDPYCLTFEQCHVKEDPSKEGSCQPAGVDGVSCSGSNCYLDGSCFPICKVSCCLNGRPCD